MQPSDINSIVGLPWKEGGRTPEEGFDCWGFFRWFYTDKLNIDIEEDYHFKPGDTKNIVRAFLGATNKTGGWLNIEEPLQYCAVALSMNKKIHHVGVWVNGGCLHATENLGVVYNTSKQLKRNGYNKVEYYICKTDQ